MGALLAAVSLLAAAEPQPARAQGVPDVENARALFVEASRRGNEGRWNEARELYARSLQLKQAPLTRYSLGVAQRESGHLADALASFRTFVKEPSTPSSAAFVEPAHAAIDALAARVGKIIVTVEPRPIEGLALTIDAQPAPPTWEGPREIDPGSHEIGARAPGFRGATARFLVLAGGTEAVTLVLTPLPNAAGAHVASGPPAAVAPLPDQTPAPPSRALPIALMAAGGGVFIVGAAVGLVGVSQASQATTRDGADASAARTKGIAGDVLAGTGIAAAGVGLILLLTQRHPAAAVPGPVTLWTSGPTAGVAMRF
jgi:hypothetical protein